MITIDQKWDIINLVAKIRSEATWAGAYSESNRHDEAIECQEKALMFMVELNQLLDSITEK